MVRDIRLRNGQHIVLENCKIDNSIFKGLTFGMGLDRITMLKHGLTDIRSFFNANLSG